MRKLRPIKRRLRIKGQPEAESASVRAAKQAVRYVESNRYLPVILTAIRSGTPNATIADFCIERGYFNVNYKTAISYLQYFRKAKPDLCKPPVGLQSLGPDGQPMWSYDGLFDGNAVILDTATELRKLIEVQKMRVSIDFNTERGMQKLFNTNSKEVQVLRELLETYATVTGQIGKNTASHGVQHYDDSVKADLQGLQIEERQRAVLSSVVQQLKEKVIAS